MNYLRSVALRKHEFCWFVPVSIILMRTNGKRYVLIFLSYLSILLLMSLYVDRLRTYRLNFVNLICEFGDRLNAVCSFENHWFSGASNASI